MHEKDYALLENAEKIARTYGLNLSPPPLNVDFINEGEHLKIEKLHGKLFLLQVIHQDIFVFTTKSTRNSFLGIRYFIRVLGEQTFHCQTMRI